jgi:hypothetical protein
MYVFYGVMYGENYTNNLPQGKKFFTMQEIWINKKKKIEDRMNIIKKELIQRALKRIFRRLVNPILNLKGNIKNIKWINI